MGYDDEHRLFLQFMMTNHVVPEHAALAMLGCIQEKLNEETELPGIEDLHSIIDEVNNEITSIDMEVRIGTCEVTTSRYIMLVNMVSSPINSTMTNYTPHELAYFKKIIDEIVSSDEGKVSSIACLNVEDLPMLSKTDLERLRKKFVEEMWFIENEGKLSLSVRSISELGPYLKKTYKDYLLTCALCHDLIFQGFRCDHCPAIGHLHCFQAYAKQNRNKDTVKCPGKGCRAILDNLVRFLDDAPVEDVKTASRSAKKKKQQETE